MNKSVVLLNSGGLDSLLAAKWLQSKDYTIHSLYLHWLNKDNVPYHPRGIDAAEKSSELCGAASHYVAPLIGNNNRQIKVLQEDVAEFADMYYTLAASYAAKKGAEYVALGIAFNDGIKPNEENYYRRAQQMLTNNEDGITDQARASGLLDEKFMKGEYQPKLLLPVYEVRKPIEFMRSLGLSIEDVNHTYSCSSYPPCRKCYKCFRRKIMGLSL